jgi:hypothetical protein
MGKKKNTRKNCTIEVESLMRRQHAYSEELAIQVEIVGTQLWLYRRMAAEAEKADAFVSGSTGQKVINTIFEQLRKYSDDLRKGLASLQMNKDKLTGSVLKKEIETKRKNDIDGFVNDLNARFSEGRREE